jgi:hypothetical protein
LVDANARPDTVTQKIYRRLANVTDLSAEQDWDVIAADFNGLADKLGA